MFSDSSFQYSAGAPDNPVLDIRMGKLRRSGLYFLSTDRRFLDSLFANLLGKGACPKWEVDLHHFQPAGFSLNAVRGPRGLYATIHVTPEVGFSYASYETNDFTDVPGRLRRLLEIFDPEELTVVYSSPVGAGRDLEQDIYGSLQEDYSGREESFTIGGQKTVQYKFTLHDS